MIKRIQQFRDEYAFLSNFYPTVGVRYDGGIYPTSEHAFQASKTTDEELRRKIMIQPSPGAAKRMGRTITLREEWVDEMFRCKQMYIILKDKFSIGDLKRKLLNTGDALLIEGNYWGDSFWGVNLKTGIGENHLGKLLMKVRRDYTIDHETLKKKQNRS
jgi:hypothetical protein